MRAVKTARSRPSSAMACSCLRTASSLRVVSARSASTSARPRSACSVAPGETLSASSIDGPPAATSPSAARSAPRARPSSSSAATPSGAASASERLGLRELRREPGTPGEPLLRVSEALRSQALELSRQGVAGVLVLRAACVEVGAAGAHLDHPHALDPQRPRGVERPGSLFTFSQALPVNDEIARGLEAHPRRGRPEEPPPSSPPLRSRGEAAAPARRRSAPRRAPCAAREPSPRASSPG